MAGLIESASLFRLAQEKAKDMRIYFDPYIEIEDKSPEAQTMFFGFLFIECLYREQKISAKAKKTYQQEIENKLQELASQMRTEREIAQSYENKLLENLREGNLEGALPFAVHLIDFSRTHNVDGRINELYRHCLEQNKREPDD